MDIIILQPTPPQTVVYDSYTFHADDNKTYLNTLKVRPR